MSQGKTNELISVLNKNMQVREYLYKRGFLLLMIQHSV